MLSYARAERFLKRVPLAGMFGMDGAVEGIAAIGGAGVRGRNPGGGSLESLRILSSGIGGIRGNSSNSSNWPIYFVLS